MSLRVAVLLVACLQVALGQYPTNGFGYGGYGSGFGGAPGVVGAPVAGGVGAPVAAGPWGTGYGNNGAGFHTSYNRGSEAQVGSTAEEKESTVRTAKIGGVRSAGTGTNYAAVSPYSYAAPYGGYGAPSTFGYPGFNGNYGYPGFNGNYGYPGFNSFNGYPGLNYGYGYPNGFNGVPAY